MYYRPGPPCASCRSGTLLLQNGTACAYNKDIKQTKTMKDNFLAAFRLLDEHSAMAFNYWETVLFDEDGEWIESEVTESNLFSMRMDACCAAGKVLCEV